MWLWGGAWKGVRPRDVVVVVSLIGHVFATVGLPLPTPNQSQQNSQLYPCQDRPCGCGTAEECWAGDCCCFTLEEKIAWARARGIEPPERARRMAAERAEGTAKLCHVGKDCCSKHSDCPDCSADSKPPSLSIRWVPVILAQKCRGEGPGALLKLHPVLRCDVQDDQPLLTPCVGVVRPASFSPSVVETAPPTPPPRSA